MNAIEVKNVYKSFKIYPDKGSTLKEKLIFRKRNRYEEHQVLKGIDLMVKKGEVIGLIGENGCGKSTLLKLLTKIIYPDQGEITVNGKVSSLLELGAGFHPDMTGRENIYTNASIFGLTKKEIDDRLEAIIGFSELGHFIDNPVRTYSSGMYMRLAFSVAINVDAEVLLVDEILAVGDAAFQAKCFNKMQEIKNEGTTIVMVSHDLASVERLCDKVVWIDKGDKVLEANPHDGIALYLDKLMRKRNLNNGEEEIPPEVGEVKSISEENRTGDLSVEIINITVKNAKSGQEQEAYKTGENIEIEIDYIKNNVLLKESVVGIGFFRNDGMDCFGTNTYIDNGTKFQLSNKGKVIINLYEVPLLPGEYTIDIAFHDEYGFPFDYIRKAKKIKMYSELNEAGVCKIKHSFVHVE